MKVLLLDTCGEVGSVALGNGAAVVAVESLPVRGASVELLPTVRRMLDAAGWMLGDLDGVGVVTGPGSFTGVRVGLAAAKGLCEAAGLQLVGVSRLEVMAGMQDCAAVLDAGRGEFYVRWQGLETLCALDDVVRLVGGTRMAVAEQKVAEILAMLHVELVTADAAAALPLVLRELQNGGGDAAFVDANYVRAEGDIYARAGAKA